MDCIEFLHKHDISYIEAKDDGVSIPRYYVRISDVQRYKDGPSTFTSWAKVC